MMRRIKIVGLSMLALLAVGAVAASTSFAAAPEFGRCVAKAGGKFATSKCTEEIAGKTKFEWIPGPGPKNKFTSAIKPATIATLETVTKVKITCTGETSGGEIANAKEVAGVVATFTGCSTSGIPCQSGATEGTIVTNSLGGVIGFETEVVPPTKNKVAEELHGENPGNIAAEFSCAGIPIVVRGSVLHNVKANAMVISTTEKFIQKNGKQKPEHFAGGKAKEHILESSTGGGPFEQAGQAITSIVKFEEKGEINTIL